MKTAWMAVALFALSVVAEEPKGTLCFITGGKLTNCSSSLHVDPADAARLFVWTSDDGARVAAGTLPAKANAIDLGTKEWHAVRLQVAGDVAHGWPLEASFRLGTPERNEWRWSVPAKSIKRFATLLLPPGRYALMTTAEHHVPATRTFTVAGDAPVNVDVTLAPLIVVSGLVVTPGKEHDLPLGGATVTMSSGRPETPEVKLLATTSDDGRFRAELPASRFAITLLVAHAGYATKSIDVGRDPGDRDFGRILLAPGATLKVHVTRPDLEDRKLTVTLLRTDEKYEKTQLATRTLDAREDELTFDDLAPAEHFVVVSGSGPLERIEKSVTIKERQPESLDVEVKPYTLDGHVRFGGEALTEGKVGVNDRQVWRAEVPLDSTGHFGGSMWQRGTFSGWVSNAGLLGTPYFTESPALGDADPTTWTIDVPKRLISGRILDEETKQPLTVKPHVMVRAIFADHGTFDSNVELPADGTYHVLALKPGDWSVLVTADGYLSANPHIQIAEGDGSKNLDVLMSHGTSQVLELTWPNGAPVANARVMSGSLGRGLWQQQERSDLTGHVTVKGGEREVLTVYVAPAEGSLAVVRVTFGSQADKPLHVTVPPPAGALRIHSADPDGVPQGTNVLVRWNGELIIPDAMRADDRGAPRVNGEVVFPRMPAGVYEIWPVAFGQTLPPAQAPVRVDLASGDVTANLVVPKRVVRP